MIHFFEQISNAIKEAEWIDIVLAVFDCRPNCFFYRGKCRDVHLPNFNAKIAKEDCWALRESGR